jgi:hypothetical protein
MLSLFRDYLLCLLSLIFTPNHLNRLFKSIVPMKKQIQILTVPGIFILLLLANFHLSSCTKTATNTVTVRDTTFITVNDTTVVKDTVTTAPSTLSLLTGKQWEIDSVYINSTGPGTGTLVYARGAAGNLENLDDYFATFTIDGYIWQQENSTFYSSTWSFIYSDSTTYKIVSPVYGIDYGRIIKLDAKHLTIYDSIAKALDVDILTP